MAKEHLQNDKKMKMLDSMGFYNRPVFCKACDGIMIFKGVGEYQCEDCRARDYDDYGKVRNYVEEHPGANAADVSRHTGVSQKAIRQLLKDEKIEVAAGSATFLRCELCNTNIRSGRFCAKCKMTAQHAFEEEARANKIDTSKIMGYGRSTSHDEGAMRFKRGVTRDARKD